MRNKAKPNGPGKMKAKEYNKELRKLQARLCHLQDWVKQKGLRVIIIFEGRDAPEAALARADAVGRPAKAREAGNRSGQYLANTVLFATCSSSPARQENLSSQVCASSRPRPSAWRCSLLRSSECSSCPLPNEFLSQTLRPDKSMSANLEQDPDRPLVL